MAGSILASTTSDRSTHVRILGSFVLRGASPPKLEFDDVA
jgi:hypothetical protein